MTDDQRCRTCRWWVEDEDALDGWRLCVLMESFRRDPFSETEMRYPKSRACAVPKDGGEYASVPTTVMTAPDFGCIQYERQRPIPPPGPDEVTRDELLDELRRRGVEVSARTLLHWQKVGAIPRGSRRWHDGKPAVLYPFWMADNIVMLRRMQGAGTSLKQLSISKVLWSAKP